MRYRAEGFPTAAAGSHQDLSLCAAGVQDDKERKGELFGMANLLKMTADTVKTREIIEREERQSGLGYRIEVYDAPPADANPALAPRGQVCMCSHEACLSCGLAMPVHAHQAPRFG